MALTVTLDPHGEQLVAACLRTGRYHSPEEVVARALESLAESPDEAIAQILGLRPEVVEELRRQARARGRAVKSYAAGLLEEAARLRAACDETASPPPSTDVLEAIERLKGFGRSHGLSLGDATIRQLREEARP